MAGLIVTGQQLNNLCGSVALNLKHNYTTAVDINNFLLANPVVAGVDPLIAMGVSASDALILRAAMADLAFAKTASFDSSTFVKQLWGLGE